ncbi:MAG: DUF5320 family protein [Mangrovibacterium sp.]
MSGLNRRGPEEQGPMTGRRMGRCNPENRGKADQVNPQNQMSFFQPGQGRGLGFRRGSGKGLRHGRGFRSGGNS